MTARNDLPMIKDQLKARIDALCLKLLPDGRREGRLWVSHNPVTGDYDRTREFKVALTRDVGAWKDWRTGDKGDVVGLIQYVQQCEFRDALDWARDFLGIRDMSPAERKRLRENAEQARRQAEEKSAADQLKRMRQAEALWSRGYQDGSGSAAQAYAERYFAARAIPLDRIANRDLATLRFSPAQEFWKRAQYRHENGRRVKVAKGPEFPAVLSAMRLATGQVAAVHMLFLDPLGPRKLAVSPSDDEAAKIMFGPSAGAVIRISHGPEGEPPETARKPYPLLIGEGFETTASVALAAPEARAWAAGSLANMLTAPYWLPCIASIILLRDQFKHRTTEQQWQQVREAVDRSGRPWTEIDSHFGNDFNDLIQGDDDDD